MDVQTIPGFLTPDECKKYKHLISKKEAPSFTTSGMFRNKVWDDPILTHMIYSRLVSKTNDMRYLRANTCVMTGTYQSGNQFSIHTDTGLYYNKHKNECSKWTCLIYLNDDFEGGSTTFYDTDTWKKQLSIIPKRGMALIFDIGLWHCGDPVISGSKQWIGCEIIGTLSNRHNNNTTIKNLFNNK